MAETKNTPASEEVIEGVVDKQAAGKTRPKSNHKTDKDTAASKTNSRPRTDKQKPRGAGALSWIALLVAIAGMGLSVVVMRAQDNFIAAGIDADKQVREAEQAKLAGLGADIGALAEQQTDQMARLAAQAELISALQSELNAVKTQLAETRIDRDALAAQLAEDVAKDVAKDVADNVADQLAAFREEFDEAARQPSSVSADIIRRGWLDGLLASSQFGQDLTAWQQRLATATPPDGGWADNEARLIDAMADAELASHQQLILAAISLAEARDITATPDKGAQDTGNTAVQGVLSWMRGLVSLKKISPEEDMAYLRFMQAVDSGDLAAVQSRFAELDGMAQPDSQLWSERVNSRLHLDRLILQQLGQQSGQQLGQARANEALTDEAGTDTAGVR